MLPERVCDVEWEQSHSGSSLQSHSLFPWHYTPKIQPGLCERCELFERSTEQTLDDINKNSAAAEKAQQQ